MPDNLLTYYDHFVVPFTIGVIVLFAVVGYKYIKWFVDLPKSDKTLVWRGLFSMKTVRATGEVVSEALLHRRIFRVNPLLGYMHMSLAFGWFLLIAVGWIEASMHLSGDIVPLHAHVFYKFFAPTTDFGASGRVLANLMDVLLLMVLSGVALAWFKRVRSRAMGLRRTTKHTTGDRLALSALWFIFPLRLLAESAVSGVKGLDSFMTGNLGGWMVNVMGVEAVSNLSTIFWWSYSIALMVFLVAMPFSRYMHIFTEIPLIFLRHYKLRSEEKVKSFDHFQIEACSRCGICIDPCQLQSVATYNDVQSAYFLRDRRYNRLSERVADNCLMCGRCEQSCPVGIELNTLRLNSRVKLRDEYTYGRFDYLDNIAGEIQNENREPSSGRVGYFAGCMTLLTPKILSSMEKIFEASNDDVWWADRDGGVCCGRPLKLAGKLSAAANMVDYNRKLFDSQNITTLVTSCPICLKTFKEDYDLKGIEVLHHSQYILRLIEQNKISVAHSDTLYTYHDPCELGREGGIYDEPRSVIERVGSLKEVRESRENALCCGSSIANLEINDRGQRSISAALVAELSKTGAQTIVTSCPLCKKAIARSTDSVMDISEIVAASI